MTNELAIRILIGDVLGTTEQTQEAVNMAVKALLSDAVEVVRCKECKHNSLKRMTGNAFCELGIGLSQLSDFCSKGERIEDAEVH